MMHRKLGLQKSWFPVGLFSGLWGVVLAGLITGLGYPIAPARGQTPEPAIPSTVLPGSVTPETGRVQTTPVLLNPGATGAAVENLQRALAQLGLYRLPVDGDYGPATVEAVEAFQRQQGLPVDGILGPQTQQALVRATTSQPLLSNLTFVGPKDIAFTPLTFTSPDPPPSAIWLVLMPMVPVVGGALTYLNRRLNEQRRRQRARRRVRRRNPPPKRLPGWLLLLGLHLSLGLVA